ncbi:sensor histidine kinase [Ramlibacter sp. RBP-2]|uniref:histidine kinase n=1 Tax=Ramlibacter lithotrophicus TaxID=2606681 RepID=A0A7X6DI72_9BURK|nr:sensor histidine kinase [Ramlibacter lithotrophicus]NKE67627.1 sensor histidine kinase [Ramlibacter lithotrophicus]
MTRSEPRLQAKLLRWLLGPLLALLVLDTAATYWTSSNFSNLAHDRSLQEIAREVVLHVKPNGAGPRLDLSPAAERILLVDQDDRLFIKITSAAGTVIGGDPDIAPPPADPARHGKPVSYDSVLHGLPVRVTAAWLPYEEGPQSPSVLVQVAETLNKRQRLAWDIMATAMVPQLLLVLLATAAVYLGVRHGLAPLSRLGRDVARRSHVDLSPIDASRVPGEVRPLVDEVNELMLRLGKTLDFQSRFIADAAHQLKTPVSGLKAQIELALREAEPQRLHHSLAQLYVGVDRLSRLVQQLLALARNEPGAIDAVQMQSLDLDVLALETSMEWVPQALRHGVDLGFEGGEGPLMITADADRLRELINNLIDNAVRYSRRGGRVTVATRRSADGAAELSISDDGPSIPVAERKRIFERFHRLLGTHADGSGLGLAIVSEIATLHGARINLEEDVDGVGNTFSVHFPPPPRPAP